MAEIIPFPPFPYTDKLAEFDTSSDAIAYLDALVMALASKVRLDAFEERQKEFLDASNDSRWFGVLAHACRILARIDWSKTVVSKPSSLPGTQEAVNVVNAFKESATAHEYTELRQLIFSNDLLRQFLECLPSCKKEQYT